MATFIDGLEVRRTLKLDVDKALSSFTIEGLRPSRCKILLLLADRLHFSGEFFQTIKRRGVGMAHQTSRESNRLGQRGQWFVPKQSAAIDGYPRVLLVVQSQPQFKFSSAFIECHQHVLVAGHA